ncbi:MAG: PQQ-binding-like beta-propeller repeat protein [Planctomycetota bacterium]
MVCRCLLDAIFVMATTIVVLCHPAIIQAQPHWPEFRGPNGNGQTTDHRIPDQIVESKSNWTTNIRGKGWSSPVIWEDQVWVTTATVDGKKMWAISLDLQSGRIIHDILVHENKSPDFCHETNSYASPTPIVEQGRAYVHFGSYGTTCLNTFDGSIVWQRTDLECDHFRGPASSPIRYQNKLIVAFDGADQQYVVALDRQTGKTLWKTDRQIEYGTTNGDLMKAYGTGSVFQIDGKPTLVYPSAMATLAYDPESGRQLWIAYHDGMNASARPVLTKTGLVIVTNGMGRMVAINPNGTGDITEKIAWQQTKAVAKKSSQLVIDGAIFMNSDKGILSCFDASNGKIRWQKRVGGAFAASPIFDGEKILSLNENGVILMYRANAKKYDLIFQTKFSEGFKASPAIANGKLIIRGLNQLYCFDAARF